MSARFCHNCGKPLPENAKFCGSCGTPVLQKQEPQPEPVVAAEPEKEAAVKAPVFTLDTLDEPTPQPEQPAAPAPVILSLDALGEVEEPEPETPAEPEAASEPEAPAEPETPAEPEKPAPEPAPEPAAAEPAAPKKAKKEKKQKKQKKEKPPKAPKVRKGYPSRSGGRTVLAVLVCLLIFVWSFACLTLLNTRLATTGAQGEKTLTTVISSLDLTTLKTELLVNNPQDPNASMADWIAGKITENYQGRVELDPEDFKVFWRKSCFPGHLASHLTACLQDVYTGSDTARITAADIQMMLQTDAALIDEVFDEQLTEEDMAMIAEAAVKSGILEQISAKAMKETSGGLYTATRVGLSWWVIGAAGLILLLLILLLGKVNRSALRTFGDAGITLMVMSGIWCIGGIVILLMPDLWNAAFYGIRPVGSIIGALLSAGLIPAAAVFGTGTLMVIIKSIGKAIVTKAAKKQVKEKNNTEVTL